ncbi:hypothetical protein SUGI_0056360 [Cryptomeria japonica]|nr:hypothetical protein SUGI_0056360 [Cryptomeria japonica]
MGVQVETELGFGLGLGLAHFGDLIPFAAMNQAFEMADIQIVGVVNEKIICFAVKYNNCDHCGHQLLLWLFHRARRRRSEIRVRNE